MTRHDYFSAHYLHSVSRAVESAQRAERSHEVQEKALQAMVADERAARSRLQADNATQRGATEALGERVASLEQQLSSAQLDAEQQRHTAIAQRAEFDEALSARQDELEAARLLTVQQEAELAAKTQP